MYMAKFRIQETHPYDSNDIFRFQTITLQVLQPQSLPIRLYTHIDSEPVSVIKGDLLSPNVVTIYFIPGETIHIADLEQIPLSISAIIMGMGAQEREFVKCGEWSDFISSS